MFERQRSRLSRLAVGAITRRIRAMEENLALKLLRIMRRNSKTDAEGS
jgi:hypothetical protein